MKKIAVIYHSSVGNTKKVAVRIADLLSSMFKTELHSIENISEDLDMNVYDGFVIGFPTYHSQPSKHILEFIENLEPFSKPKPTYIFTTSALYSANSLRIFAKKIVNKNFISIFHSDFNGCPATDGILLAPFVKRFYSFPKNLDFKVQNDVKSFAKLMFIKHQKLKLPRFKLYSILNYPNKLIGNMLTFPIYLHSERCNKCGKCMRNCLSKAIWLNKKGYPSFIKSKCDNCYRCIHHCSSLALSLSKKSCPKKVFS